MCCITGIVKRFVGLGWDLFFLSFFWGVVILVIWWRDVVREGTIEGSHLFKVVRGLGVGMVLFIISEVLFFISFF